MELREWATRILSEGSLEEKLLDPGQLTDFDPGPPLFWKEPTRLPGMTFSKHKHKNKLPKLEQLSDPSLRAICIHRFAGHELLAVEIMAYALLAFPHAPKHFRKGLAGTLREEQQHVRLYRERLLAMGLDLDSLPHFRHFWAYTPYLTTPEQYLSVMSLTFEMANLDYAPTYGAAFLEKGDLEAAALMDRILQDEVAHVSFGWHWLTKLKPAEQTHWDAWRQALPERLSLGKAMGKQFFEEHRKLAGVSNDWIERYKDSLGI